MAEPPPFDLKLHQVAVAMHGHPGSLSAKLRFVWELTERMLRLAEDRHRDLIHKAWGLYQSEAFASDLLDVRAELAEKKRLGRRPEEHPLIQSYFGALSARRDASARFLSVQEHAVAQAAQSGTYAREQFAYLNRPGFRGGSTL